MRTRTWAVWTVLVTAALVTLASGCSSCNRGDRARAQGVLDAGVHPGPMTTATCYLEAQRTTPLLQSQINELCQGAPNTGPVECYVAARRSLMLTDPQKIALCHCAPSLEPVACWLRLQSETMLLDTQIETMCSPTITQGLLPNCRPIGGY